LQGSAEETQKSIKDLIIHLGPHQFGSDLNGACAHTPYGIQLFQSNQDMAPLFIKTFTANNAVAASFIDCHVNET